MQASSVPSPARPLSHVTDLEWPYERLVDSSGRIYFVNHQDRTTSWKHPLTGLGEPEVKADKEGRSYFVDHAERRTTWLHPRLDQQLRDGDLDGLDGISQDADGNILVQQRTEDGKTYVVNHTTGSVTEPQ